MKFLICLFILMFSFFSLSFTDNLITNGGFEDDLEGWEWIWTRDEDAGSLQIITDSTYSGSKAVRLKHWGVNDWSFRPIYNFPVNYGEIYHFSSWIKVKNIKQSVSICLVLYDSSNQVIEWAYGNKNIITDQSQSQSQYQENYITVNIPENVTQVCPRFIGFDSCEIDLDEISFELVDSVSASEICTLQNNSFEVILSLPEFSMQILDQRSGCLYSMEGNDLITSFNRVDSTGTAISLECNSIRENLQFTITVELFQQGIKFYLQADSTLPLSHKFSFPGKIQSKNSDFYFLPKAAGMILPVTESFPFWVFQIFHWKGTMAFSGVTDFSTGYLIVTDDPWDSEISFESSLENGLVSPQLVHHPSKNHWGYDRTFYLTFAQNDGYNELCAWYRHHVDSLGYVNPFSKKKVANENIDKLIGAVDFWILEWDMKTKEFIDTLSLFGIDRAIISIGGGWEFDEGRADLISHINSKGFLSSRYDIYTDVWPPEYPEYEYFRTEGYPEDVIVQQDGSLQTGWLAYLDGDIPFQGYYTCSATHAQYLSNWVGDDLLKNDYLCRFFDVELSSSLYECYSKEHPTTRHQDALYRADFFKQVKDQFNLVAGSEEAREFAFPYVDYGEGTMSIQPDANAGYDWTTPITEPGEDFIKYNVNGAIRVPLHGLVYHDVHVPTWYTGDGVSKVPAYWDEKDLLNILYATMPLFFPPNYEFWIENREKFITSYHLVCPIFRKCGYAKMTSHQFITSDRMVQKCIFDNGWEVIVNFGENEYPFLHGVLPSKGFYATDGIEEVFRIKKDHQILAAANLQNMLFLQPYEDTIEWQGIKTSDPILLKKDSTHIDIALVGEQKSFCINPSLLPWQMEKIIVSTYSNHTQIFPDSLENGWLIFNQDENERFYFLFEDSSTSISIDHSDFNQDSLLTGIHSVYPNPFSESLQIIYSLNKRTHVKLSLTDLLGNKVKIILDEVKNKGQYKTIWNGKNDHNQNVGSGIYFLSLNAENKISVKKIIHLK